LENTLTYFDGTQHRGTLTLAAPVNLTGASQALLRYREWRQVGSDVPSPLDVASVQVSRNGADWTTVSESFLFSFDWQQRAVDLTPFVGGPVYLRFEFDVNAFGFFPWAMNQGYEGWRIDDVQILVPADQPAGLSINDVMVTEGHDGTVQATFTVTRTGGGHASVRYATAAGSAASGSDFAAASGTLVFGPGETRKTLTVSVNGDRRGEANESFFVNLSNPTGAAIADGQGKADILDDEPRVLVTGVLIASEGNEKQTILVPVTLGVPSDQSVTVSYATADGTAIAKDDYLFTAGTVTFNPGETRKLIAIELPKDQKPEAIVEAFFINLSNVSSNAVILRRGVVHIIDDDPAKGNGNEVALARAGLSSGSLAWVDDENVYDGAASTQSSAASANGGSIHHRTSNDGSADIGLATGVLPGFSAPLVSQNRYSWIDASRFANVAPAFSGLGRTINDMAGNNTIRHEAKSAGLSDFVTSAPHVPVQHAWGDPLGHLDEGIGMAESFGVESWYLVGKPELSLYAAILELVTKK
jgi:hypothetical protein